jgi:hypothetical protein
MESNSIFLLDTKHAVYRAHSSIQIEVIVNYKIFWRSIFSGVCPMIRYYFVTDLAIVRVVRVLHYSFILTTVSRGTFLNMCHSIGAVCWLINSRACFSLSKSRIRHSDSSSRRGISDIYITIIIITPGYLARTKERQQVLKY